MGVDGWNKIADQVNFNLDVDWDKFQELVDVKAKVLDFGCGYGRIVEQLSRRGYSDVVGIDPSYAMIERGCRSFPELSLLYNSGQDLPFYSHSFDAIIACAVFTSIPSSEERQAAVGEIARVLKPGGLLHLSEFCASEDRRFMSTMGVPMRYSTPEVLQRLFESFESVHSEVIDAKTMGGKPVSSYRTFVRKPVDKVMHATSA